MNGQDLRRLRLDLLKRGLKQFAEHIGMLPSEYSDMETGRVLPSPKIIDIYLKLKEFEEWFITGWFAGLPPNQKHIAIDSFLLGIRDKK